MRKMKQEHYEFILMPSLRKRGATQPKQYGKEKYFLLSESKRFVRNLHGYYNNAGRINKSIKRA